MIYNSGLGVFVKAVANRTKFFRAVICSEDSGEVIGDLEDDLDERTVDIERSVVQEEFYGLKERNLWVKIRCYRRKTNTSVMFFLVMRISRKHFLSVGERDLVEARRTGWEVLLTVLLSILKCLSLI